MGLRVAGGMINLTLGVFLALNTTAIAQSTYEVKNDKAIEASAAARAAARIGEIRGTISFDEVHFVVQNIDGVTPSATSIDNGLAPRPSWTPENGKKKLPPMVKSPIPQGIDTMPTGSILKPAASPSKRIEWDVFDKFGRIVKRP